jgi:FkbM family methyltransferase
MLLWALRRLPSALTRLGLAGTARFLFAEPAVAFASKEGRPRHFLLTARSLREGVRCRPFSSDREAFWQIFGDGEYEWLRRIPAPARALDCGANIGAATVAIARHFPDCRVLAVEPDRGNFQMLTANVQSLSDRVRAVMTAVWPTNASLVFDETPFRDNREWSVHLRECRPGERPDVDGMDIPALLKLAGWDDVDLLKMDVEGAETAILRGDTSWLDRVGVLAVELHDPDAVSALQDAVDGGRFRIARHGEMTLAVRAQRGAMSREH